MIIITIIIISITIIIIIIIINFFLPVSVYDGSGFVACKKKTSLWHMKT